MKLHSTLAPMLVGFASLSFVAGTVYTPCHGKASPLVQEDVDKREVTSKTSGSTAKQASKKTFPTKKRTKVVAKKQADAKGAATQKETSEKKVAVAAKPVISKKVDSKKPLPTKQAKKPVLVAQEAKKIEERRAPKKPAKMTKEEKFLRNVMSKMSLKAKVSQLFVSYPPRLDRKSPILVGGVILLGNMLKSEEKLKKRIKLLQKRSKVPLLVTVDMEGGVINRMRYIGGLDKAPSPKEMGKSGVKATFEWGKKIGRVMRNVGVNCNLAPVLDLAARGYMHRLGRSFGADPKKVSALGSAFSRGLRSEGVLAIGKHFPGYGSMNQNSDFHQTVLKRNRTKMKHHLSPFYQVGNKIAGVMMANIGFSLYGGKLAIFSPEIVSLAHKRDWVTMTDDLSSHAMLKRFGGDETQAVRRAFLAGNDVLLVTRRLVFKEHSDPRDVIIKTIKEKPELNKRLERSVMRILRMKYRAGFFKKRRRF